MTQNQQPVSTVTKHIKIYSDNPIHDCIDRIMDACSELEDSKVDTSSALWDLCAACAELEGIGKEKLMNIAHKEKAKRDEKIRD
jgi:hypothetical protein